MGAIVSCLAINLCECAACMACSCCSKLINFTMSQAARFAHMLIILTVFTLAIILGKEYPNDINGYNYYTKIDLTGGCDEDNQDNCIYRQLIYRASFSCFLLFTVLAVGSFASDYINRSLWILKFGAAIGVFIAFWWADNSFFSGWAEAARVLSFIWLLVQGLLFIDFAHDAHDLLMTAQEGAEPNHLLYLAASLAALAAALIGLVFLFMDYTGCELGMFFTVLTLIVCVLSTAVSLLEAVGGGLLAPCLVFAYAVFMCWYALLSHPDEDCNPTANATAGVQNGAVIVVSAVSLVILLYCVGNGTKILNIFNPDGEGVMASSSYNNSNSRQQAELTNVLTGGEVIVTQQPSGTGSGSGEKQSLLTAADRADGEGNGDEEVSSGTPYERGFYHLLLMLVCCYSAMILTNWGRTDGAPASAGSASVSQESLWLKITGQWVFLLLFIKTLHVRYINSAE